MFRINCWTISVVQIFTNTKKKYIIMILPQFGRGIYKFYTAIINTFYVPPYGRFSLLTVPILFLIFVFDIVDREAVVNPLMKLRVRGVSL